MIRWNRLLTGVGITAIILSGCGTAQNAEQQKNGSTQPQTEVAKTKDKKTETVHSNVSKDGSVNPNSKNNKIVASKQQTVRLLEQKISYNQNGTKKEETAFLKHSNNDAYSLYVLPEYELSAEEPNRDIIALKSNGTIFMRIETLSD
ncbi:MAG: hypothetical protein Q8906_12035, partial [Bacillota bacterium]|nr:hypothetical protein [Bacillota bacterium]